MKYWRGYLTAVVFAGLTLALQQFAKNHGDLLDMVYPYMTRIVQDMLTGWSSGFSFCLWQILVGIFVVILIATVVLMVILRWNFFQWLGWVLACVSIVFCLHTGLYGLNTHCSPLAEDIRLNVTEFTVTELVNATTYYRDKANALAPQIPRDAEGKPQLSSFEEMAGQAGEGFKKLTYEHSYSVFGGNTAPVKELGMSDMFTSMGIAGMTMPLTGEAAVNPQIPGISLPFTMCHEMAHRMCISQERDANLAAFLACQANSDPTFQYSAYFMAYRYCYSALRSDRTSTAQAAAKTIQAGVGSLLQQDLTDYDTFFAQKQDEKATNMANKLNDTYIQVSGDESGVRSYEEVSTLLVSWYIQEVYLPAHQDEVEKFDPLDPDQVDLDYGFGG